MMRSNTAVNHPKKKEKQRRGMSSRLLEVRKAFCGIFFFFFWRRLEGGRPKIGTQKVPKKAPNDENISI